MHAITLLAAAAAFFTTVISTPITQRWTSFRDALPSATQCLSDSDVTHLTDGFALLVNSTFNPTLAADVLSVDFTDFSDSINFLTGQALGSPTFASLIQFDAGQGGQPTVPFSIQAIEAVTCDTIVMRWLAYPGPIPSRGITIIHATVGNGTANGWQIRTQYAEFNVAAWTNDTPGGSCVAPPPPPPAKI